MEDLEKICKADDYCLVVYRNFDDGKKHMSSKVPIQPQNLEAFIRVYKTPSLQELTSDTYREIFGSKTELMLLICSELDCDNAKDIFSRFAVKNRIRLRFAFVFIENPIGQHVMKFLGINSEADLPSVRILKFEYRNITKFKRKNEELFKDFLENKILRKKGEDVLLTREERMRQKLKGIRQKEGYGKTFKKY